MSLLPLLLGLPPALAAGGPGAVPIVVGDAWATPSVPGNPASDVYLTIDNRGDRPDSLLGVETGVAADAEVAVTTLDANDFPSMSLMQPLWVPAASETVLQPGAIHVMLMGLQQNLTLGESFPVKLVFAHAGTIDVTVRVESAGGTASAAAPSPAKG